MTHPELVKALVKPGEQIIKELTAAQANLLHMAVGVSGEAGELLDAVKKVAIYQKDIDMRNIIEELGDLEFYMEGVRQQLNLTREQCLQHNIAKLSIRYDKLAFSNEAAQKRADKEEPKEPKPTERHHPLCECPKCRPNQKRVIEVKK